MIRVPVHIVTGVPRSGESDLVRRLAAERPFWRSLRLRSCPCCVARVELQVTLARLLREEKPERVFIELPDTAHLGAFGRVLGEWPLSRYLRVARSLHLPQDASLPPDELDKDDR